MKKRVYIPKHNHEDFPSKVYHSPQYISLYKKVNLPDWSTHFRIPSWSVCNRHRILTWGINRIEQISIITDSQAALRALTNPKFNSRMVCREDPDIPKEKCISIRSGDLAGQFYGTPSFNRSANCSIWSSGFAYIFTRAETISF